MKASGDFDTPRRLFYIREFNGIDFSRLVFNSSKGGIPMQRTKMIALLLLLVYAILTAPLQAAAQGIDVDPLTWDFGDIPVGSSDTVIVTVTSTEPLPLRFESVTIVDDASGSFSIVSESPPPTKTLLEGEFLDVTVEYTPSGLGMHSAKLYIQSDAEPPRDNFYVPLQGVGGSGSTIEDILDFFDESIANGTLTGDGPGNSANGRLNALRNMLEMAGDLISIGDIEGACGQLKSALGKCDGESPPPDFVAGEAVYEFHDMITELMAELGCE
jgi:hypothetical protein